MEDNEEVGLLKLRKTFWMTEFLRRDPFGRYQGGPSTSGSEGTRGCKVPKSWVPGLGWDYKIRFKTLEYTFPKKKKTRI